MNIKLNVADNARIEILYSFLHNFVVTIVTLLYIGGVHLLMLTLNNHAI